MFSGTTSTSIAAVDQTDQYKAVPGIPTAPAQGRYAVMAEHNHSTTEQQLVKH